MGPVFCKFYDTLIQPPLPRVSHLPSVRIAASRERQHLESFVVRLGNDDETMQSEPAVSTSRSPRARFSLEQQTPSLDFEERREVLLSPLVSRCHRDEELSKPAPEDVLFVI